MVVVVADAELVQARATGRLEATHQANFGQRAQHVVHGLGRAIAQTLAHGDDDFVDVCALCQDVALEHGWIKEGAPTSPALKAERRRRGLLAAVFQPFRPAADELVLDEPILRRLSADEQAIVEAAELFNTSTFRRTVSGIAKSLGDPLVSIVPLAGARPDVVVTVAWDISWYQYRVDAAGGLIRLERRGDDPDDLDERWRRWNGRLAEDGRLAIA
jgi:hypothetical protein